MKNIINMKLILLYFNKNKIYYLETNIFNYIVFKVLFQISNANGLFYFIIYFFKKKNFY